MTWWGSGWASPLLLNHTVGGLVCQLVILSFSFLCGFFLGSGLAAVPLHSGVGSDSDDTDLARLIFNKIAIQSKIARWQEPLAYQECNDYSSRCTLVKV